MRIKKKTYQRRLDEIKELTYALAYACNMLEKTTMVLVELSVLPITDESTGTASDWYKRCMDNAKKKMKKGIEND